MNRSYNEEMDILFNDFNNELKNIMGEKSIEELGLLDLKRLKHEFESLQELNIDLKARAKQSNISDDNLGELLFYEKLLKEDIGMSISEIEAQIESKNALLVSKIDTKEKYITTKKELEKTLDSMKVQLREIKANNLPEIIIRNQENIIQNIEEQINGYDEIIEKLNEDIDILNNGGLLPEFEVIKDQSKGLSEEEIQKEQEKINNDIKEQTNNNTIVIGRKAYEEFYKDKRTKEEKDYAKKIQDLKDKDPILFKKIIEEQNDKSFDEKIEELEELLNNKTSEKTEQNEEAPDNTIENEIDNTIIDEPEFDTEGFYDEKTIEEDQTQNLDNPKLNSESKEENKKPSTLADWVKQGRLPDLSERQLLNICANLGISAGGMDFVPNEEQLFRLDNDKDIRLALTNQNIKEQHDKKIDEFREIVNDYDELKIEGLDSSYESRIDNETNEINELISDYERKVNSIRAGSVTKHVQNSKSPIKTKLEKLDAKTEKINNKLRKQYEYLDAQRKIQSNAETKRKYTDYRIRKTEEKIASLVKKSGEQFSLINEQTKNYIISKNKKLIKYREKQKRIKSKVDKVNQYKDMQSELIDLMSKNQADYESIQGKKLFDMIERGTIKAEINRLAREVKRLDSKIARVDKSNQLSLEFESLIAWTRGK